MSVIPTVYNQGTGLIGSTTSGSAIPSNIDDLIVNDTLLVGGEATFNGAVTINNTLTVSGVLTFQDVTVQGTFILEGKTPTQLAFYTTGGELTGTADMTYSGGVTTMTNVTVTTALSFGALTKTDSNNYAVAFHDNNRICIAGSPNTLTFNPSEGKLAVPNVTVGDDLTVTSGDVTLTSGDLIITNIPEVQGFDIYQYNNILIRTNDGSIRRDDNLTFRSEDGTLRTERFLGDLEGEVKLRAPDDSASGDCLVPFITPSSFNFIGKLSKNTAFTFNPSTGNLSSGTLTADTVTANFIRIQPLPDTNTSDNVPILFCDTGDNNTLKQDTEPVRLSYTPSLNKFFTGNAEINSKLDVLGDCEVQGDIDVRYNPGGGEIAVPLYEKSTGTVYAPLKLWTTGQLEVLGPSYLHLAAFTNNTDYGLCLFDTSTNELGKESNPAQLKYNPNANRLTLRNLTAEVSVTSALPSTNFDGEHPCFFQNPGGTFQNRFEKDTDFSHYTYNPGQGRLTVYKLEVTDSANITGLTITPVTRNDGTDYPVVFYDSSTSQICVDTDSAKFTYNPLDNKLTVDDMLINTKCVVNTEARSNDYEYRFVLQDQATFQLVRDSALLTMTYNPLEERFTCENVNPTKIRFITGQIFNHVTFVYMGLKAISNNGTDLTGLDYNIALWNDGHVRVLGRNNIRLMIYNPQLGTETERLNITDSQIVANATLALTATGADTGTINVDPTLYLVYSHQTGHTFRIGGNGKLRLFNTSTVIYEKLLLQTVAVPTASASLPILVHNSSNNEVQKTDVSGTNQITIDPSQGLLTTKDIYVNGTIYNNVLALNYVQTYTSRDDGSTHAYITDSSANGWGGGSKIVWRIQGSQGANPTIKQYGRNVFNGSQRGVINFQSNNKEFFLAGNTYAGWYFVTISCLWQNISGTRLMPMIELVKKTTPLGSFSTEDQVGQGCEYTRDVSGELSNMKISGPIYMASSDNRFSISTKLEDAAGGISIPPAFNETTLDYRGLGLTISLQYLGKANSAGETVNAL